MATHDDLPLTQETRSIRHIVLTHYRQGSAGEIDPTIHLVSPHDAGDKADAGALCGVRIHPAKIETLAPEEGIWCTMCMVCHVTGTASAPESTNTHAGDETTVAAYQDLGWPITQRGENVSLDLDALSAMALVIPALVGTEVADLLIQRHCSPAVLAHPTIPAHRIILAGDPYAIPLPWPTGIHRITGTILLPPTVTARGSLFWVHAPQRHSLNLCREIDVLTALLHTARDDPPPTSGPAHI